MQDMALPWDHDPIIDPRTVLFVWSSTRAQSAAAAAKAAAVKWRLVGRIVVVGLVGVKRFASTPNTARSE
jgi:hypothetical protein